MIRQAGEPEARPSGWSSTGINRLPRPASRAASLSLSEHSHGLPFPRAARRPACGDRRRSCGPGLRACSTLAGPEGSLESSRPSLHHVVLQSSSESDKTGLPATPHGPCRDRSVIMMSLVSGEQRMVKHCPAHIELYYSRKSVREWSNTVFDHSLPQCLTILCRTSNTSQIKRKRWEKRSHGL